MPYHPDLQSKINDIMLWADLRQEQGADIEDILKKLRKSLNIAYRDIVKIRPTGKAVKREPDALKDIRKKRPEGPRKLWPSLKEPGLRSRMQGAWLGRLAGCTLGAPVEGWSIERMEWLADLSNIPFPPKDYWTMHPTPDAIRYRDCSTQDYLRDSMKYAPVDDDITYTILGLLILERFGPDFTVADAGAAWLDWLPMACTAEHVALENLRKGVPAEKAADKDNPYIEWIGADIRSDPWAYAAPAWPEKAAELAWRDAWLSHRGNGIYGAMYFAAAISAAFAVNDPMEALEIGLTEIPSKCRLATDLKWAFKTMETLQDWRQARALVDERFPGMSSVHTNNNACLTVFGLFLGGKDFTKTIGYTVAMGLDNDCTAATAGSLLGAVVGIKGIPTHFRAPFNNRTRTYLNDHEWFKNTEVVDRFIAQAKCIWNADGTS